MSIIPQKRKRRRSPKDDECLDGTGLLPPLPLEECLTAWDVGLEMHSDVCTLQAVSAVRLACTA